MPRLRRVKWDIVASTNANATTIKNAIDVALGGRAFDRTPRLNTRTTNRVQGDYVFVLASAADAVYTTVLAQLQLAIATSGWVDRHDCDHAVAEDRTMTGCTPVARFEKALP